MKYEDEALKCIGIHESNAFGITLGNNVIFLYMGILELRIPFSIFCYVLLASRVHFRELLNVYLEITVALELCFAVHRLNLVVGLKIRR